TDFSSTTMRPSMIRSTRWPGISTPRYATRTGRSRSNANPPTHPVRGTSPVDRSTQESLERAHDELKWRNRLFGASPARRQRRAATEFLLRRSVPYRLRCLRRSSWLRAYVRVLLGYLSSLMNVLTPTLRQSDSTVISPSRSVR